MPIDSIRYGVGIMTIKVLAAPQIYDFSMGVAFKYAVSVGPRCVAGVGIACAVGSSFGKAACSYKTKYERTYKKR